jgi:uncharacterized protein
VKPLSKGQSSAATPSPTKGTIGMPMRQFGKHEGVQVSALGLGGHHLGSAKDEQTAIDWSAKRSMAASLFNCWEYHRGKSENWMGKGLKGRRDKIFLTTKVCTHGRDGPCI